MLKISPLKESEHDDVWRLCNDPEIIPTKGCGQQTSFLEFGGWLAVRVANPNNHLLFGIRVDGLFAGYLNYDYDGGVISIHITLKPGFHRCGYGPGAIMETLPVAYKKWGNLKVTAGIIFGNVPACKMFSGLGFKYARAGILPNGNTLLFYELQKEIGND